MANHKQFITEARKTKNPMRERVNKALTSGSVSSDSNLGGTPFYTIKKIINRLSEDGKTLENITDEDIFAAAQLVGSTGRKNLTIQKRDESDTGEVKQFRHERGGTGPKGPRTTPQSAYNKSWDDIKQQFSGVSFQIAHGTDTKGRVIYEAQVDGKTARLLVYDNTFGKQLPKNTTIDNIDDEDVDGFTYGDGTDSASLEIDFVPSHVKSMFDEADDDEGDYQEDAEENEDQHASDCDCDDCNCEEDSEEIINERRHNNLINECLYMMTSDHIN
tara:strand:- start:38375 stop:39196 length:822 start_codon:yes stop_codon:yes gene_type:complete